MNALGEEFAQASRGMRAVLPFGADWSPTSLKIGALFMIMIRDFLDPKGSLLYNNIITVLCIRL